MSTSIKLTQSAVKGLPFVQADDKKRQHLYFDTDLKGLGVCVGAKSKTFFVQRDINGKTVRTSIGRYGVYTVEQAREEPRASSSAWSAATTPADRWNGPSSALQSNPKK